jgi:rhodanese-related sulfurtransferase
MIKKTDELIRDAQQHIRCIDIETAKKIYDEADDAIIVDVREKENVLECKLGDSIHVPRGLLEMKMHKVCENPDTVILTHCAGGGRASLSALTLQNMGYRNVYAITGKYEHIKEMFG